jgi:hypothetical protein
LKEWAHEHDKRKRLAPEMGETDVMTAATFTGNRALMLEER